METRINIKPRRIILESSTFCTLSCPTCPNAAGEIEKYLGRGYLRFSDFKEILDRNPQIYNVELSNWGESFLNKDLIKIIEYAYKNNILLSMGNGSNMNNPGDDVIEAMVKYKFRKITCAIDGASQETYSKYRVNGDFNRVIRNIENINRFKKIYNSFFPLLHWRFIIFGHNEHEIFLARNKAKELGMVFSTKLAWGDLYNSSLAFSPVKDLENVRKYSGLGVATREEFREKYGKEYKNCCRSLWIEPCINYDGKLLGCAVNYWEDYGNILKDSLARRINSSKADYAREMLMGRVKEKKGIPCTTCNIYRLKKKNNDWIQEKDVKNVFTGNRKMVMLQNMLFRFSLVNKMAIKTYGIRTYLRDKMRGK